MSFFGRLIGDNPNPNPSVTSEPLPAPADVDPFSETLPGMEPDVPDESEGTEPVTGEQDPANAEGAEDQSDDSQQGTPDQTPTEPATQESPSYDEDDEQVTWPTTVYAALEQPEDKKSSKPKIVSINSAKGFRTNLINAISEFYAECGIQVGCKSTMADLADGLLSATEAAGLIRLTVVEMDAEGSFVAESDPDIREVLLRKYQSSLSAARQTRQLESDLTELFGQLSEEDLKVVGELAVYQPPKGKEIDAAGLAHFVSKLNPGRRDALIGACKAKVVPAPPAP